MPIKIKEDLIRGASSRSSLTEFSITRVFEVSGISSADKASRMAAALNAQDSETGFIIPQPLDPHPDPAYSQAVVYERVTGDPTYDVIDVYVVYRVQIYPSVYLKSASGTLRSIPWVATTDGKTPLLMTYTPAGATSGVSVPIIYHREILAGTFSFRFMEGTDPEVFNTQYAGCFNKTTWRGYAPRTIKLLPVAGSTQDGHRFINVYSFNYRPETHDEYVFYRDQFGRIPPDVSSDVVYDGSKTQGNGWARLQGNGDPTRIVEFRSILPQIDPSPLFGLV